MEDWKKKAVRQGRVFNKITDERYSQDKKWGEQNHDNDRWMTILTEEVGEAAKAVQEESNLEEELIQVAAVAVAWLECLERKKE